MNRREQVLEKAYIERARFRRDFPKWVDENYSFWLAFEREANAIWESGRRHYSARTICEFLRHETALRSDPGDLRWKVNDHLIPDLSRLYLMLYEDRAGFFETRVPVANDRMIAEAVA